MKLYLHILDDDPDLEAYDFACLSRKVIVKDNVFGKYLSANQIKKDETLIQIQNYIMDNVEYSKECLKVYLATINGEAINEYAQKHGIVAVLYINNGWTEGYYCYALRDIYAYSNGTIVGNLSYITRNDTLETAIEDLFDYDDYTYTEIS